LRRLFRFLPTRPDIRQGVGDDCAVVHAPGDADTDWILTSDPVIEGTHFRRDSSPAGIGHKAIGRVLSDVAAMGGEPDWALIDLVAPSDESMERLEAVYAGARALADLHGLAVVGGDLARGPLLELHVFACGHLPTGSAVLRSGAKPGHGIYVTGQLGGSLLGRHLNFEPRLRPGVWLRSGHWASAMMDLSDGLGRDLLRMMESSAAGAVIQVSNLPISGDVPSGDAPSGPLDHALFDGEDFELLFTVPPTKENAFLDAWRRDFTLPCTRIGQVVAQPEGTSLLHADGRREALQDKAYEHFI
jgi:thiamine-monophosphate kinase